MEKLKHLTGDGFTYEVTPGKVGNQICNILQKETGLKITVFPSAFAKQGKGRMTKQLYQLIDNFKNDNYEKKS